MRNLKILKKGFKNLKRNQLVFLTLAAIFIGVLAVGYFIYYRARRTESVYVSGMVLRNINYLNTPITWVPFWMSEAINLGDRDFSQLGRMNAQIIDKETLSDRQIGKQVNLLLRVYAIKDRLGLLLYKNKPLSTGGIIELRLPKTTINLQVTGITEVKPQFETKDITVETLFKNIEPWQAEIIKPGDEIKNNKNQVLAKILSKNVSLAEVSGETLSGEKVVTRDRLKRDMTVTLELKVTEKNGEYFFFSYQKIWPNQNLYLPWPGGKLYHNIISVSPVIDKVNK